MKNKKSLCAALAVVFALNITLISLSMLVPDASAATYKKGSSGEVVSQIQTKLKNWGYYSGSVDGVYGSKTVEAVKSFQKKNGLTVDGICGTNTLAALGLGSGASTSSNDVNLLARLISAEARGEPYVGQVAVGAVVLNRMEHPSFPNTMSGVIYQKGAFSCICLLYTSWSRSQTSSARSTRI